MRKDALIKLVKQEAQNLKKFATPAELYRLDSFNLRPTSDWSCIYGQMTGSCNSERAVELIKKCAIRCYSVKDTDENIFDGVRLNGKIPKSYIREERKRELMTHLSPIEVFIYHNMYTWENKNNDTLIDYLRGETNILTFK